MRFFFCLAFSVLNLKANTTKKQLDKQGLAFYGVIIGLVCVFFVLFCLFVWREEFLCKKGVRE